MISRLYACYSKDLLILADTYSDLIPRFGRSVPEMPQIMGEVIGYTSTIFGHLLRTMNQPWLQPNIFEQYVLAVYEKSSALDNCWRFVDGTVRPI